MRVIHCVCVCVWVWVCVGVGGCGCECACVWCVYVLAHMYLIDIVCMSMHVSMPLCVYIILLSCIPLYYL